MARQPRIGLESPRNRVKQAEIDSGQRPGLTSAEQRRIAKPEREVRELSFIREHRDRWGSSRSERRCRLPHPRTTPRSPVDCQHGAAKTSDWKPEIARVYRANLGVYGAEKAWRQLNREGIRIHRGPWRTRDQVELATAAWVGWWNHHRLHSAVGDVPPAEYEADYHRQRAAAA